MSYQTDDGLHEGWGAAELPDGRFSVGSGDGGTLVRFLGPEAEAGLALGLDADAAAGRETVDGRTAIGWRGVCECGWRGPLWERVTEPPEHTDAVLDSMDGTRVNWAARKVFDPALSVYGDAPSSIEDSIYQEWRGHLPSQALTDIRAAAEDAHKVEARLNEAVQRARADGSSWADIGAAAGITRQSAHERWARR